MTHRSERRAAAFLRPPSVASTIARPQIIGSDLVPAVSNTAAKAAAPSDFGTAPFLLKHFRTWKMAVAFRPPQQQRHFECCI